MENEKEIFYRITYMLWGEDEQTEEYADIDDARADYLYMIQERPEDYRYVVLDEIITDYNTEEEINTLDSWYNE